MIVYRVRYTPEAVGRIRKLHPEIKKGIRDAIRTHQDSPLTGHTLQQEFFGDLTVCGPPIVMLSQRRSIWFSD